MSDKVKVGIPMPKKDPESVSSIKNYIHVVEMAGGVPVTLELADTYEEARERVKDIHAMIVPGGGDVNPARYHAPVSPKCGIPDDARDASDDFYFRAALERDMPVFAICRGFQVVNVSLGGTLYQDIEDELHPCLQHRDPEWKESRDHDIAIEPDSFVGRVYGSDHARVNSYHHQAVKDAAEELRITARTSDGIPEAYESTRRRCLIGTQFHPEKSACNGDTLSLEMFRAFIREVEKYRDEE